MCIYEIFSLVFRIHLPKVSHIFINAWYVSSIDPNEKRKLKRYNVLDYLAI